MFSLYFFFYIEVCNVTGEKADSKVKRRTRSSGNETTLDDTPTLKKHKKTVPKQGTILETPPSTKIVFDVSNV